MTDGLLMWAISLAVKVKAHKDEVSFYFIIVWPFMGVKQRHRAKLGDIKNLF